MKRKYDIVLESYVAEALDYNKSPNPFEESDKVREIIKKTISTYRDEIEEKILDLIIEITNNVKKVVNEEYGENANSAYSSYPGEYSEDIISYVVEILGLSRTRWITANKAFRRYLELLRDY